MEAEARSKAISLIFSSEAEVSQLLCSPLQYLPQMFFQLTAVASRLDERSCRRIGGGLRSLYSIYTKYIPVSVTQLDLLEDFHADGIWGEGTEKEDFEKGKEEEGCVGELEV